MVAILNNIRSIHNVGSIFRTADGAGIKKLYLCGYTPTPLNKFGKVDQRMAKVALGAEKTVEWEKYRRAGDVIRRLKKEGFKILAVEQDEEAVPYWAYRVDEIASSPHFTSLRGISRNDEIVSLRGTTRGSDVAISSSPSLRGTTRGSDVAISSSPSLRGTTRGSDEVILFDKKIALVVGNEVKGLSKPLLKKCDKILEIPMCGKKKSLNVSVAFGIVAFELTKP